MTASGHGERIDMPIAKASHQTEPPAHNFTAMAPSVSTDYKADIVSYEPQGFNKAVLSVIAPSYLDDPLPLINSLSKCEGAASCEVIIYLDGWGDRDTLLQIKDALKSFPGRGILIAAHKNAGRALARERLQMAASADWFVFLDADMRIESTDYLTNYFKIIRRSNDIGAVFGGFSIEEKLGDMAHGLHYAQSLKSECISADERKLHPGAYLWMSNLLVARHVMDEERPDPEFVGWGWEDCDWGLRVAQKYKIDHIDNRVVHLGLEKDDVLIGKYRNSGDNFRRVCAKHPVQMKALRIYKTAKAARFIPLKNIAILASSIAAKARWLPLSLRLYALKTMRIFVYSKALYF